MAVESMEKCRRDSLWNKMLIMISKSDDHSADDKRKKRSDTEDSRGVSLCVEHTLIFCFTC